VSELSVVFLQLDLVLKLVLEEDFVGLVKLFVLKF